MVEIAQRSRRHPADELSALGHDVSCALVGRVLEECGYIPQANRKARDTAEQRVRDEQFRYVARRVRRQLSEEALAISFDTKRGSSSEASIARSRAVIGGRTEAPSPRGCTTCDPRPGQGDPVGGLRLEEGANMRRLQATATLLLRLWRPGPGSPGCPRTPCDIIAQPIRVEDVRRLEGQREAIGSWSGRGTEE
jgi:hypothetical protein